MLAIVALIALCGGCTRKYWREQADDLAYDIIRKKAVDPRWDLARVDVMPDPRSRFFDPFDPDFTPLPPDDPAAHEYMNWVYGMNGYKNWHKFGDLPAAENPDWLEPFGMSQEVIAANYSNSAVLPDINKLTLEEAVELAWIHSRDYQTQVENVYLAALALTFQRFQFDLQFVGLTVGKPSAQATFEDVPGTSDSVSLGRTGVGGLGTAGSVPFGAGVSQLFPSGAQFVAELANNTLWLFSGGNQSSATASTFSYSLVQPLLANAGRRYVMEGLTLAERNMLYALRDLARYRMGFFTSIVAGGTTAGLTSGVQNVAQPLGALASPTLGGGGSAGGYLLLLQQMQSIYNLEYNISQLKEQLDRLHSSVNQRPEILGEDLPLLPPEISEEVDQPAAPDGEVVPNIKPGARVRRRLKEEALPLALRDRVRYSTELRRLYLRGTLTDVELHELQALSEDATWRKVIADLANRAIEENETLNQQLAQLQTQLASNCISLRSTRVSLQNNVDQYKLFLGLPTDMPITIDDSLLKPFEFIDPRLLRLQDRLKAFVPEPPEINEKHPDAEAMLRVQKLLAQFDRVSPDPQILRRLISELELLQEDIRRDGIEVLASDFQKYEEHAINGPPKPLSDGCFLVYRDAEANKRLQASLLAAFDESVANLAKQKAILQEDSIPGETIEKVLNEMSDVREEFLKLTRSLSVVQINLRVDLIDLNRFDIDRDDAVGVGLENRMDLMNLRAQVMDARRTVEVAANQLQAVLNIVAAGDIRTQSTASGNGNPFDFRGDQSSIRAGVQFTSPVQLVQQRNTYRAALIAYQRARRNYMRVEDQVKFDIRTTWRQLTVIQQNFETAREQVRAAAAQLDIQSELSTAPVIGVPNSAASNSQGLNILQALNSVLTAQNQMIQLWVNFEFYRLNIYNFMGTMEIDEFGFWVDDFYQRRAIAARMGRSPDDLPPQYPADLAPPSPPQELRNDPANATEIVPQPVPENTQRSPGRRRDKLQLVRGETWPDRPAPGTARSGREGGLDPAGAPDNSRRRRLAMEAEAIREPGRAIRSDR